MPFSGFSQDNINNGLVYPKIEGLSIYPNPVSHGKAYVYITSKNNSSKKIVVYNVLGKQVWAVTLTRKELDISGLSPGIYILKITENKTSETRKLIIK